MWFIDHRRISDCSARGVGVCGGHLCKRSKGAATSSVQTFTGGPAPQVRVLELNVLSDLQEWIRGKVAPWRQCADKTQRTQPSSQQQVQEQCYSCLYSSPCIRKRRMRSWLPLGQWYSSRPRLRRQNGRPRPYTWPNTAPEQK